VAVLNKIFDFLFGLIAALPQQLSLILVAAVFGILLVPVYGRVSPQLQIAKAKKRIFAALYESVIFRRSSALSLKAQGKMGLNGLIYFCLAIPPILILAIPCLIVLAQCNLFYGVSGLLPSSPTLVIARLAANTDLKAARLTSAAGIEISAPVRDLQQQEIAWRITLPETFTAGAETLQLSLVSPTGTLSVPLEIGAQNHKVYPFNSSSFIDNLFYPRGLQMPPWLSSLEIRYPERNIPYLGFSTHWMLPFLVVSILSGYIASKFFGVEV
jgi:hypothetical protein